MYFYLSNYEDDARTNMVTTDDDTCRTIDFKIKNFDPPRRISFRDLASRRVGYFFFFACVGARVGDSLNVRLRTVKVETQSLHPNKKSEMNASRYGEGGEPVRRQRCVNVSRIGTCPCMYYRKT